MKGGAHLTKREASGDRRRDAQTCGRDVVQMGAIDDDVFLLYVIERDHCLLPLLMFFHIVTGRHAVELLEDRREGGWIGEAAGVHDFGDVHALISQQLGSFLQADVADEVVGGLPREVLHLTVDVDTADTYLIGYHIDAQVGVVQILVDAIHDAVEEFLVGRLHAYLVDLLLQFVVALILQPQQTVAVDEIDDGAAQDVHIEWLDDVGIGTRLQSFELVFIAALGGEQDDGDDIGARV